MRRLERANLLPALLALAGFGFDMAAHYPGQMSFDSAYTWWQARGGETTDTQAPMLVHLWRLCDAILPGPGLVFALHLLLFWAGLALIALGLRLRWLATVLLFLLVGMAPMPALLRSHVWTDVGFTGAMLVVTGALTFFVCTAQRRWLIPALLLGFYALSLRHNALPALLPLVVYAVHRFLDRGTSTSACLRTGAASAIVLAVLFGAVQAINANVDRHGPMWPALAEFDLAALSIAANEVLFPGYVVEEGMDVSDLRNAFRPWGVNAVLAGTQHGIRDPHTPSWTTAENAGLARAWFAAISSHPREYLAHRLEVSAGLFGTHPREWPSALIFVDAEVQFRDNPPVTPNTSALHRRLMQAAEALRDTPALAAWPYLALGLIAAPVAWWRRERSGARVALVLLASAALLAAPLVLVAPSTDLRYLMWPGVAAMTAMVLAFART